MVGFRHVPISPRCIYMYIIYIYIHIYIYMYTYIICIHIYIYYVYHDINDIAITFLYFSPRNQKSSRNGPVWRALEELPSAPPSVAPSEPPGGIIRTSIQKPSFLDPFSWRNHGETKGFPVFHLNFFAGWWIILYQWQICAIKPALQPIYKFQFGPGKTIIKIEDQAEIQRLKPNSHCSWEF